MSAENLIEDQDISSNEQDLNLNDSTAESAEADSPLEDNHESEDNNSAEDNQDANNGDAGQNRSSPAPEWLKVLRKANREKDRKIKELESKLTQNVQNGGDSYTLEKKPTLEDFLDPDQYELAIENWLEKKRKIESEKENRIKEELNRQKEWQKKLDSYNIEKSKINAPDFEDAEEVVKEILNVTQQGILLQGAESPADVVLALGRNPAKAEELASITDPVKFAFAIAKLDKQNNKGGALNKKAQLEPEFKVVSNAKTGNSTLERLRQEAERTGDYSKVSAFRRQLLNK